MDNRISIAAEIAKAEETPAAAAGSLAAQIKAEEERQKQIEGKLAEDQNRRVPPELQAKALPLAKAAGVPIDVARRNIDALEAQRVRPELDKAKAEAPSYAKVLQDEGHGPIAQSAVTEMPWFERVVRSYGQAWTGGFEDLEASDIGYRRMQGRATPQDLARLEELKQARKQRTDFRLDPVTGFFQYPVGSAPATGTTFARTWDEVLLGAGTGATVGGTAGAISGPGAIPAAGAGALTGAGVGLRVGLVKESYEQLAGDAYNEALEARDESGNPLDEDTAYTIATFAGGIGAVAELLPFEKALDTMPFLKGVVGKEGARRLAGLAAQNPAVRSSLSRMGRILKVGGAEAFTEVLQEALVLEGIIASGGVTDEDGNVLADQRLDRYSGAAVGGFAGGTTLGAAGETVTATVDKVSSIRAQRAEAKKQALVELGDRIRNSRVNGLSPETVVAHAKQIDADGAGPQMSAPAEKLVELFQSEGLTAEQVQERFPTIAAALDEAAQGNAEVPLNAEMVTKLAQLEGFASITDDIRTGPEELTVNEAKQADQELTQMLEGMSEEDIAKAVDTSIQNQVAKQLMAAGAEPRAADTQAKLFTSVVKNLAERTGMDPDQLLKRYGVEIVGDGATDTAAVPDATTLAQFRETPEFRNWFGDSKVVDESGAPLVVYHGTTKDVSSFKPGSYFTVDRSEASAYTFSSDIARAEKATGKYAVTSAPEIAGSRLEYFGTVSDIDNAQVGWFYATDNGVVQYRGDGNWNVTSDLVVDYSSFDETDQTIGVAAGDGAANAQSMVDEYEALVRERFPGGEGGNVVPVYLNIKNPKEMSALEGNRFGERLGADPEWVAEQIAALKAQGYDGIVTTSDDPYYQQAGETPPKHYIAFDPTQIKSVNNRGTFDPQDPNILYQDGPTQDAPAAEAEPAPEADVAPAVEAASLDSSNTLSKSQSWNKGRDLKIAMQDRVLAALRALGLNPSARSPEAIRYLVKVGVKDALAALAQNPNAIGWYDVKTRQALAVMSLVHPEIMSEPNARFAFTWALAVTSNGIKVGKNFEFADSVYRRYKADGRMPTDIQAGQAQKAINESLQLFNELTQDWGIDNLRKFMLTDFTVSEITGINKELSPSGEFAETLVRGAAVLGPKIGNGFFSNLYGVFDALTMDRWLVRTWGRWTGTLIEIDPEQVAGARNVLRDMAGKVDVAEMAARLRAVTKTTKTKGETPVKPADRERLIAALEAGWDTDEKVDALAAAVQKASQEPKFRKVMNEVPGGTELRTKGNNLAKYLDGQKEQPAGPAERNYIREVFQGILDELRGDERYTDLTMADLQAVLWYAEKRLYETAKEDTVVTDDVADGSVSGYEDEEAPDYANAAAAQARADGVPDEKIKATLKEEAERGSATRAGTADQSGAGSQAADVAGGQGGGAQAARGFTRNQKRSFIHQTALHRIRSNRRSGDEPSWSYRGEGGAAGKRPRVLKSLGVRYVDVWKAGPKLRTVFKANGIQTPEIYELETGSAENAARFVSAISSARSTLGPIGEAVHVYPAEQYAGMRLFLSKDGMGGFALKPDGDIVSVFSAKGQGNGRALMETAVAAGGRKLDCFHTILPEFYSPHGFRGVSRLLWNDEVAQADMPNWDKAAMAEFNGGEPDVVFMVYDPSYMGVYDRGATPLFEGDNAYGDAVDAQTAAMGQPTTLLQTAQSRQTFARGSISFSPARDKFTITLTGKADLSTFMHESAHYFLEVMQDIVEKGDAPAQIVQDLDMLRSWMKLEPNEKIERRHHEMFARGFEAYLMEGRAPSNDLQGIFNRFRAWLVFIYKRMAALDVQLTDEVRGVMDRLVASDREIAEARTSVGLSKPLPKEALYLSDEEYDRYVQAWGKANEAQQREIDARLMREAAEETKAAWKEERARLIKEETEALAQTRGYRAWKLLSEGTGLQDVRPGWSNIKIDPASVPSEWRRDVTGMTAPPIEGGLPLDTVAEILGFRTGEEMIALTAGAKQAARDIPRNVARKMKETHGHMDAVQLAEAAMDAVHSDKTQEVLLTEYRAMAAQANIGAVPTGLTKWMAAQAQQKVLGLTRRQLDPMRWRRAELKAATDSAKAAAKGDMTKAAIHKRQQLMAAAMYRATVQADKRVDVIRRKLIPFTKNDRRAKLGKAGDLYLDGIDQILEDIQLKPMSAASVKKLDRLEKLVAEADKNGEPLVLPDKLRAMLGKKNFADMTLEELEGVHDAVMNIWHLAKLKNELKARKEKRDLDEALTEMEENARRALGDPKVTVLFTKGWKDRAAARMRAFRAGLVKMEFLFGWLDGKPDGGLMHRLIYQPIADANKAKYDILKRFQETIIERMRSMPKEQKARWESKRTFMGNPTANGATIISAALNLGNEGNKKKLLEGYGWNEQRLMAEINAFMTKADWDFVQHVWDEIDTLWPKIEATTKAATGLAPEKVVASPIVTPFGTYAGGYYPVVYDPEQTEQQFKNQQESAGLFTNNYARPTLGDGFTKARVEYSAPILLELSVISQHLAEVVHYVTHYEAVTQADKITKHPRFQALVKGHMGNEFYRTIRPWLQDVARDQDTPAITNQEPFAKAMRHLRGGVSIAAMGYNIFTGVKQLIGVVQSLDAVGPKYWLSGLQKAWLSPNAIKNWKFAFQNSQELEPLVTQLDRDIKMVNDAYAMEGTLNMPAKVASWAFKHIGWLQAAVNVATWHGAYEQDLAKNDGDHEKAVMHADAVVRQTQSAGSVKDLSPIQRGSEINRAVSMFYSWFNVLYNRFESIARETKSIRDVPKAAARVAILVMMSSMIEEAGRRAWEAVVDNYEDDEEEAGYILSVLLKSADTAIGAIPLGRVFISAEAAAGGMTPDLVPVASIADSYWRTARAAYDLVVEGEAPSRSEVKAAVRTISIIGAVPLSGPYNFLDELFGEAVFGEGKKTKP